MGNAIREEIIPRTIRKINLDLVQPDDIEWRFWNWLRLNNPELVKHRLTRDNLFAVLRAWSIFYRRNK